MNLAILFTCIKKQRRIFQFVAAIKSTVIGSNTNRNCVRTIFGNFQSTVFEDTGAIQKLAKHLSGPEVSAFLEENFANITTPEFY